MVQNTSRLYLTQNRVDASSSVATIQKSGEKTLAESPSAPLMNLFTAIQMKSGLESAGQDWTKDDFIRDLYQCCLKLIPSLPSELKENGKLSDGEMERLSTGMSDAGGVSQHLTKYELGRIEHAIEETLQQMVSNQENNWMPENDGKPDELIELEEKYTQEFLSNDPEIEGGFKSEELAVLERELVKLFSEQSVKESAADGLGAEKSEELYHQAVKKFDAEFKGEYLGWKTFQIKGHSPERPELDRAELNSIKDDLGTIYEELPGELQPIANELQLLQQSLVQMADCSQAILGKQQDTDEATKTRHSVRQLNGIITAMKAAVIGLTQAKEMLISAENWTVETAEKSNPMAGKLLETIKEIKSVAKVTEARAYEVLSLPGPSGLDYLNKKEDMKELQNHFGKSTPHILIANGVATAVDSLAGIVGQLKEIANYGSLLDSVAGKIKAEEKRDCDNVAVVRALNGSLLNTDWQAVKERLSIDKNDPFFKLVARVGEKVENKFTRGMDVLRFALGDPKPAPKLNNNYYKAPNRVDEFFQPVIEAMRLIAAGEKWHIKSPPPAFNAHAAPYSREQQGDALLRMLKGEFNKGVTKAPFSVAALEILTTTEKLKRVADDLKAAVEMAKKSKNYFSDAYLDACKKTSAFAQEVSQSVAINLQESLEHLPVPKNEYENKETHQFKESLTSAAAMLSRTAADLEKAASSNNKAYLLNALKVIDTNNKNIKAKIKDSVESVTGHKLHNFDIDGRLGKAIGMWASEQVEQYSKAHPEVPPEIIERAMDHVFNENLKQRFGRTNDPNAVLLRNRVVQALNDTEDGNLSLPDKITKELERTDTFGKYLQEWGLKKMTSAAAAGVIASSVDLGFSSIDGLVNHVLNRMISIEGRKNLDIPRPAWLKAMIAPATITLGMRALQNSAMPNQGEPVEAIKKYLKREVPKAVFRLVTSFLPRGVNLAMAAPLAIWAIADKDRMEHLKKLGEKFPRELIFSAAYVAAIGCQKWDSISAPQARAYQGKDDAVEEQVSKSADILRRGRGGPDGMQPSEEAAIDWALSEALQQLKQEKDILNNLTPKQRDQIRGMGRTPEGLQTQCEDQIKRIHSYMKGGENENQLVIVGPAKMGHSKFDACVQRGDSHQRIFIREGVNDLNDLTHVLRHELVHLVGTEEQETRQLMALLDSLRTGRPVSLDEDKEIRDTSSGLSFAALREKQEKLEKEKRIRERLARREGWKTDPDHYTTREQRNRSSHKPQPSRAPQKVVENSSSNPPSHHIERREPTLTDLIKEYDEAHPIVNGRRNVTKNQARSFYTQLASGLKRSSSMTERELSVVNDIYRRAYPHEMNIAKLSWNALSEILKDKGVSNITPDTIVDITVKKITVDGTFGPEQPMKVKLLDLARGAYVDSIGDGHVDVVTDLPPSIKGLFHTTPYVGRQTFDITTMLNSSVQRKLSDMEQNESVVFREQIWKGTVKNTLRRIGEEKNIKELKDAADSKIKTGYFTLKNDGNPVEVVGIVAIPKGNGKQILVNILTGKTLEVEPDKDYGPRNSASEASIKNDAEALKAFLLPNFNLNKNKFFTETDKDAYAFSATRYEGHLVGHALMSGQSEAPTFYRGKFEIHSVDSLDQLAEQFSAMEISDAKNNANFLFTTEGEVWAKSLTALGKRFVNGVAMATLPVSNVAGVAFLNIGLTLLSHGLSALEISVEDDDTKRAQLKTDLALDIVLSLPGDAGDVVDVINRFKGMKQAITLGGGQGSWHNTRPPLGVQGNPPVPPTIGRQQYGQKLDIKPTPENGRGQWDQQHGTLPVLDSRMGVNGVDLNGVDIVRSGPNQGTYLKDGKTYIQQDDIVYELRWDDSDSTWRIQKPGVENGTPVHYDADTGSWRPGGQKAGIVGDNNSTGRHGTLPVLDSTMGVNDVDLNGVDIVRSGPNQGTYLKDGKTYIQQDDIVYELRWDDSDSTWRIQKPDGGYGTPVHYDADTGSWGPGGTVPPQVLNSGNRAGSSGQVTGPRKRPQELDSVITDLKGNAVLKTYMDTPADRCRDVTKIAYHRAKAQGHDPEIVQLVSWNGRIEDPENHFVIRIKVNDEFYIIDPSITQFNRLKEKLGSEIGGGVEMVDGKMFVGPESEWKKLMLSNYETRLLKMQVTKNDDLLTNATKVAGGPSAVVGEVINQPPWVGELMSTQKSAQIYKSEIRTSPSTIGDTALRGKIDSWKPEKFDFLLKPKLKDVNALGLRNKARLESALGLNRTLLSKPPHSQDLSRLVDMQNALGGEAFLRKSPEAKMDDYKHLAAAIHAELISKTESGAYKHSLEMREKLAVWWVEVKTSERTFGYKLNNFTDPYKSTQAVEDSVGLRPSVSGVVNGQAGRIEYDLNEQGLYERRAQVFERVENRQGAEVRLTTSETNGIVVNNQVMDALNKNPNGKVYVLTGTHGSPNGVRDRELNAEMRFTIEDTQNLPPAVRDRVVVVDLAHSTDAYVQDLLKNAVKGDTIIGGFCFSRNDNVIRRALGLEIKPSHIPKYPEQSKAWLSNVPANQYGPTWGTTVRPGGAGSAPVTASTLPAGTTDEYFEMPGNVNLDSGKRYVFQIGDTGGRNWTLFDDYAKSSMAKHGIPQENVFGELSATRPTSLLNPPQSNTLSQLTLNDRLDIPVHGSITGPSDPGDLGVGRPQHFSPKQLAEKLQSYGLKQVGVLRIDSCNVGDGDYLVRLKKELDKLNIKVGYLSAPNGYLQATHLPFLHIRPVWQTKFWNPWNVVEGNAKVDFKGTKYSANPSGRINENASTSAMEAKIDFGTLNYSEKVGYLTQSAMNTTTGQTLITAHGRIGAWKIIRACVLNNLSKDQSAEGMDEEAMMAGVLSSLNEIDKPAPTMVPGGEYRSKPGDTFYKVRGEFKKENPNASAYDMAQFTLLNMGILSDHPDEVPAGTVFKIPPLTQQPQQSQGVSEIQDADQDKISGKPALTMVPGGEYRSKPGDNFYTVRNEFKKENPNASNDDIVRFQLDNAEIGRKYGSKEVPVGTVFKLPPLTQQPQSSRS
ncbi:hypothetical protein [Chromobacterium sp. CV08]|uniref:hypothetical protein n=1 Tax=Chromobacterium sp. CV08 TaxID=3133274 RepID=UPI003DA8BDE2